MKAIILAAGEGTRLRPITYNTPKPLIKIYDKSILEHNIQAIYKYVEEITIIVNYKKELIEKHIGNNYKGTKISYHTQGEQKGTAAALKGISQELDTLIMNGDSIFSAKDLEKIITFNGYGALVQEVENPKEYGIFQIDEDNNIKKVVEKPEKDIGNLASLGVYKFNAKIFEYINEVPLSERGEYEITDAINTFAKNYLFKALPIDGYIIDIGYPWHILTAHSHFLKQLTKSDIKGEVEEGVTIKGNIILEEGALLKSGSYIEGNVYIEKNTTIGPNAYIRENTLIRENCHIGNAVEIKNSTIGANTHIAHLSYVGDSVIGDHVNIGCGFITANLRHDSENIKCMVKKKLVDTKLKKFGVIIGDYAKIGINNSTYPGRIINNNTFTRPGTIIQ